MSLFSRFLSNRRGNVAIIFGLMAVPVMFMAGSGYDYARASRLRIRLQAAVDGTALTLCQTPLATTSSALETQAKSLLASYMPEGATLVTPLPITQNPRQITVTASASNPMAFAGLMGVKKMDVAASSRCATPMPQTFEIALVLDTTGSMADSDGTNSKLASAQKAAKQFIDFVANNDSFDDATRIAVVPFAASVAVDPTAFGASTWWIDNAGQSAYHWQNIDVPTSSSTIKAAFKNRLDIFAHLQGYVSSWGWAGCFESLPYPLNTKVEAPTVGSPNSYFVPLFAPDEPGTGTTDWTTINNSASNTYPRSKSSYKNLSPSTQYFPNSYLNDETASSSCDKQNMTAQDAEDRACKYRNPVGYQPTTSGGFGLPNGPNFGCNSKPLKRLTTNFTSLKTFIDTLKPLDATNIFEGFMWGWRTLSPRSVLADGSPESRTDVGRVVILMTDGQNTMSGMPDTNFNQTGYTSFGYYKNADGSTMMGPSTIPSRLPPGTPMPPSDDDARAALDSLTATACTNAKTAGISVYTIGFSVPSGPIDAKGLALLQNCASTKSQAYVASSADQIIKAFDDIAKSIGKLRLTQ